jgi:hypothetical protein
MSKELEKAINKIQDGEDIGIVLIDYAEHVSNNDTEDEFLLTRSELKDILHSATGNIRDFVTNEDGFINDWYVEICNKKPRYELPMHDETMKDLDNLTIKK